MASNSSNPVAAAASAATPDLNITDTLPGGDEGPTLTLTDSAEPAGVAGGAGQSTGNQTPAAAVAAGAAAIAGGAAAIASAVAGPAAGQTPAPALMPVQVMQLPGNIGQWALDQAKTLGQQIVGQLDNPQDLARLQGLITRLALSGLRTMAQLNPTELLAAQEDRALILSALADFGVIGEKSVEDLAKQAVGKMMVEAADFVLQGVTKLGL